MIISNKMISKVAKTSYSDTSTETLVTEKDGGIFMNIFSI